MNETLKSVALMWFCVDPGLSKKKFSPYNPSATLHHIHTDWVIYAVEEEPSSGHLPQHLPLC